MDVSEERKRRLCTRKLLLLLNVFIMHVWRQMNIKNESKVYVNERETKLLLLNSNLKF